MLYSALRRSLLRTLAAVGAVGVGSLALLPVAPAQAVEPSATVAVDGHVAANGELTINETITFAQGAPATLVQKLGTRQDVLGGGQLAYTIDQITARAGITDLAPKVVTDGDFVVITIDPAKAGRTPVSIGYRVVGAARPVIAAESNARTEVAWKMLQGLSVPVDQVSGTLATAGTITYVNCEAGAGDALVPCSTWGGGTHENPQPSFTDGPRAAGDVVQLEFGIPSSVVTPNAVVKHPWSLDRAFSVNRSTLLASLLPLLLGGGLLYAWHRRSGRDQISGIVTPIAEFTPVGAGESRFTVLADVRPGHVGTVADERVDPVDVTATLLDLAVRGWIRIVELPRDRAHQAPDWRLERTEGGEGDLRRFENSLRDAIAPAGGGVLVSDIDEAIAPVIARMQGELYDDVVARGWFDRRPDSIRGRWQTLGWVALALALVATLGLVLFTTYGLVGIALMALALGALVLGQEMPSRTAAGTELLAGLSALASQLQTQPTTHLPAGDEYHELSRILPYAVVLGGRERWIRALVDADRDEAPDGDELGWYSAPGDWHLRDLPDSLDAFVVAVQGRLFGR